MANATITEDNRKIRTKLVNKYNMCKTKERKRAVWEELKAFETEMLKIGQNG